MAIQQQQEGSPWLLVTIWGSNHTPFGVTQEEAMQDFLNDHSDDGWTEDVIASCEPLSIPLTPQTKNQPYQQQGEEKPDSILFPLSAGKDIWITPTGPTIISTLHSDLLELTRQEWRALVSEILNHPEKYEQFRDSEEAPF